MMSGAEDSPPPPESSGTSASAPPPLPTSESSSSLKPPRADSSSSFLPPIFPDREGSRSGSDSCESRTDVAQPGWLSRTSVGSRAHTSHSNSPPTKSPTKLPRLDSRSTSSGDAASGVASPAAAAATTPEDEQDDDDEKVTRLALDPLTRSVDPLTRGFDPLTRSFLIGAREKPPDKTRTTTKLPLINSRSGSCAGDDDIEDYEYDDDVDDEVSPPRRVGRRKPHRRKKRDSGQRPSAAAAAAQPPRECCRDEEHFFRGLCHPESECFVAAAEAAFESGDAAKAPSPSDEEDVTFSLEGGVTAGVGRERTMTPGAPPEEFASETASPVALDPAPRLADNVIGAPDVAPLEETPGVTPTGSVT